MNCHKKIIIYNNIKFYAHPIYDSYAASKKGQIYSEKNRIILKQYVGTRNGKYLYFYAYGKKEKKEEKKKNILPLIDLFTNVFTAKYQRIKKLATLIIISIIIA